MTYKLKGWMWAVAGVAAVLFVGWVGVSIYTFFDNLNNAERITRIEERVVGVGKNKPLTKRHPHSTFQNVESEGGDAHQTPSKAHQQPGPRNGGHPDAPKQGPTPVTPQAPSPTPGPPPQSNAPPDAGSSAQEDTPPPIHEALNGVKGVAEEAVCSLPVQLCP